MNDRGNKLPNEEGASMYLMSDLLISKQKFSELTDIPEGKVESMISESGLLPVKGSDYDYNSFMAVMVRVFSVTKPKKRVIVNSVGKGGVGKTSLLSYNLPFMLAVNGYKVLLVDLDYQMNLTTSCRLENVDNDEKGILPLFLDPTKSVSDCVDNIAFNVDLIRGTKQSHLLQTKLSEKPTVETLNKKLIRDNGIAPYDYVFFDTHSAGGMTTSHAFRIADMILSPIIPDKYTTNGIGNAYSSVLFFNEEYGKDISYRIVINNYEGKQSNHKRRIADVIELAEGMIYHSDVRRSADVLTSIEKSTPVFALPGKRSNGYKDILALSREFVADTVYGESPRPFHQVESYEQVEQGVEL